MGLGILSRPRKELSGPGIASHTEWEELPCSPAVWERLKVTASHLGKWLLDRTLLRAFRTKDTPS